jgi:hypothetical protein
MIGIFIVPINLKCVSAHHEEFSNDYQDLGFNFPSLADDHHTYSSLSTVTDAPTCDHNCTFRFITSTLNTNMYNRCQIKKDDIKFYFSVQGQVSVDIY